MPKQILMPALSPTMTEGKLAKWHVAEGADVAAGDVLAEIETDKATMEVESIDDGKLGRIVVAAGTDGVAVNSVIGIILEDGEDAAALEGAVDIAGGAEKAQPEPAASPEPAPAAPAPAAVAKDVAPPAAASTDAARVKASPLARRMAGDAGVDLASVAGSGPGGRIVKADIESVAATGGGAKAGQPARPAPAGQAQSAEAVTAVPHSQMRKVIAARLTESKQSVPHYYITVECQIDALMAGRKELNARQKDVRISVNDFIVRASALALAAYPNVNASWSDEAMLHNSTVDVAVAVALDDGLVTPIVRNADKKGLTEISIEMKELAARAREGKLLPEEYQGGGMSISNLGMYGVREFTAVINPPQSVILAVGTAEKRAVVKGGDIVSATMMTVTLSCDHRVVDGALGAQFLRTLRGYLEQPLTMLL